MSEGQNETKKIATRHVASILEFVAPVSFLAPVAVLWVHLRDAFRAYGALDRTGRGSLVAEWSSRSLPETTPLDRVALEILLSLVVVAALVVAETFVSKQLADRDRQVAMSSAKDLAVVRDEVLTISSGLAAFAAEKGPVAEARLKEMADHLLTASHSLQTIAAEARRTAGRDNAARY